jgi:hypothetical protein
MDFGCPPAGNHISYRFPLILDTLARLRSRSCAILMTRRL